MKKILSIILFSFMLCFCSACFNGSNQQQSPQPQIEQNYMVKVRTTQFDILEGVSFFYDGQAVESTYVDGYYSFKTISGDSSKIMPVKKGYKFISIIEYHPEDQADVENMHLYFVAAEENGNSDFEHPFGFHGKVCDAATNEIGISNTKIMVGNNVVFVTDETGNFDISNLFEPTMFTFSCEGYVFDPDYIVISEETAAFRIREVVQE